MAVAQASSIDIQNGQNIFGESVTQGYKFIQHSNIHAGSIIQQALASNGNQNATGSSNNQPNMEITIGSFLLSALIVLFLFFFVYWWAKFGNRSDKTQGFRTRLVDIMEVRKRSDRTQESQAKLGDIIRDGSGFPSLARFQFLLWTLIVTFAVLSVYFIRLLMGIPEIPNDIPENLLILMGISVAVPFVSTPLSSIKYGDRRPATGIVTDQDRRSLATMLMENDKITVSRFQMFAWTWISIIIYLGFFFSQTFLNDVNDLVVPDIPQIFVYLMGLSQVGYVGTKAAIPGKLALSVTKIAPNQASKGATVSIYGTNFGEQKEGKVLFETGDVNELGERIYVVPGNIVSWDDKKIEIKVPDNLTEDQDYFIRVEREEFTSFKGGGMNQEAKFKVLRIQMQVSSVLGSWVQIFYPVQYFL